MTRKIPLPTSKHFRIEQLADGVYAAFHKDRGWLICNAGVIDLGNETLVFDTGITPKAAHDLRTAAIALTGRAPHYVLNSHYHNDHIRGNQVFTKAIIVSTTRTRELITTLGQAELEADQKCAHERLEEWKTLARSEDPEKRKIAAFFLPYWQGILTSLPEIRMCRPDLTFNGMMTFHGIDRTAQLIEVGGGHTENDCVLFLPQESVLFCGDLLFVRSHPYLGDGDPETLLSALDKLENLRAKVVVPGHGPVGDREDLDKMRLYIRTLIQQAKKVVTEKGTADDAANQPVPEPFADWILFKPFYEANMRFLYSRLVR